MNKPGLSIVIPTLNEEENILPLVRRINHVLTSHKIEYEIIFVDDHSTDKTQKYITACEKNYAVSLFLKQGNRGKAFSLLEGFEKVKYSLTAMIDADLQYPPEYLVPMYKKIFRGKYDVVVADRQQQEQTAFRKVMSQTFNQLFIKKLHGLDIDAQSGLKIFRSEIIKRIQINPTPWTFDLEFLLKARDAKYKIASYPISFKPRVYGQSKIQFLSASMEIALNALQQKFALPGIAPFPPRIASKLGLGFHFKGQAYVQHTLLPHQMSALYNLNVNQKKSLIFASGLVATGATINWTITILALIAVLTLIYFVDLIFYLYLIYKSMANTPAIKISKKQISEYEKENEWPTYTIFCPLYKEGIILPQFVQAMANLDYPKDRLQVLLLLEEDDQETIDMAREMNLPEYFEIVVTPNSLPKTKPKACNYGLFFGHGEYSVIYDAEDIPDTLQLKKAVLAFENADPDVICVQAKLNFYNPDQNLLTRLFTAEYSLWFDLILPGLQTINAPIPLGGTSNHFKSDLLRDIGGWDAFNVAEDCDLGIRLVRKGYQTAIMNSLTLEEANSDLKNWFWQRTRWIKGYLQTYLVHMRHPVSFVKSAANHQLATFQLVVGGKIFLTLINPLMWILTLVYFLNRGTLAPIIDPYFPAPVLYMGVLSMVIGNFLYLYYYMIGSARRGSYGLIKYLYLVPIYWLWMSAASWVALYQLLVNPHYWSKTKHGLHLNNEKDDLQLWENTAPQPAS